MTHFTEVTWVCDRCGAKATVDKGQPGNWASLRIHMPPNSSDPEGRWDICKQCETDLADFLFPPGGIERGIE